MPSHLQDEDTMYSNEPLTIPAFNEQLQSFIRRFVDPTSAGDPVAGMPNPLIGDPDTAPKGGRCWLAAGTKGCMVLSETPPEQRSCFDCAILKTALADPVHALLENALILTHQLTTTTHGLREQAVRDPLTGLHNRRFLSEVFPPTAALARRQGHSLWLLAADVDGLKRINDDLGHHAGDEALVNCARLLRQTVRSSDLVFRMGGDEFLVVLVNCDQEAAELVVGRIHENIALYNAVGTLPPEYPLALSVGAARYESERALKFSMAVADSRMYAEKRSRKAS
jgi:diguanylate cyclase (GGDEF)-like protein